jgi:hypothetical protein
MCSRIKYKFFPLEASFKVMARGGVKERRTQSFSLKGKYHLPLSHKNRPSFFSVFPDDGDANCVSERERERERAGKRERKVGDNPAFSR